MLLPVLIAGWEIECCLQPPSVGDVVSWSLRFVPSEEGAAHDVSVTALDAEANPLPDWDGATSGRWPVRLAVPAGTLYWDAPEPVSAGKLQLAGNVFLGQHGEVPEDFPATAGVVRRVQVTSTKYVPDRPGSTFWRTVQPLDVRYRDVETAPDWFDHMPSAERDVMDDGVLVDLEISPTE